MNNFEDGIEILSIDEKQEELTIHIGKLKEFHDDYMRLKEQKEKIRDLLTKYLISEEYCGKVGMTTTKFAEDLGNVLNELEGKNE